MNNRDPSPNQNNSRQICCMCAIAQTKHILDWTLLVPYHRKTKTKTYKYE